MLKGTAKPSAVDHIPETVLPEGNASVAGPSASHEDETVAEKSWGTGTTVRATIRRTTITRATPTLRRVRPCVGRVGFGEKPSWLDADVVLTGRRGDREELSSAAPGLSAATWAPHLGQYCEFPASGWPHPAQEWVAMYAQGPDGS
jgi:hypothetical protein